MKSLNEDLKTGQFKQVYLLYGEESYLKKQYKDRLSKAMLPEGDTMNYAYYEGKGTDVKQVIVPGGDAAVLCAAPPHCHGGHGVFQKCLSGAF